MRKLAMLLTAREVWGFAALGNYTWCNAALEFVWGVWLDRTQRQILESIVLVVSNVQRSSGFKMVQNLA